MIYEADVKEFLSSFDTNLAEISYIWQEHQRFLSPEELTASIIERKPISTEAKDVLKKIASSSFAIDFRTGALVRQNFYYGLADYYASHFDRTTAIVEFDVGNCNGTGDVIGDDNLFKVLRFMRGSFEKHLSAYGATSVQAFDNAKNDDLKIVVTGLDGLTLTSAIEDTQAYISKKFITGIDIKHSKYSDGTRDGIGVGSGFCKLGRDKSVIDIQQELNLFVEKRKLEDAISRNECKHQLDGERKVLSGKVITALIDFTLSADPSLAGIQSPPPPVDVDFSTVSTNSVDPQSVRNQAIMDNARALNLSEREVALVNSALNFYNSEECLTGARKDDHLYSDIQAVTEMSGKTPTILNVKVENCAGINKVLTHIHSAAMTKHFVNLLQDFTEQFFGEDASKMIYYVGRNSFNIILPESQPEEAKEIFNLYFQPLIDEKINAHSINSYFDQIGYPAGSDFGDMKVGDIPNTRGNSSGVTAINVATLKASDLDSETELLRFQNKCLAAHRYSDHSYEVRLPQNISLAELENANSPREVLQILQSMAHEIILLDSDVPQDIVAANQNKQPKPLEFHAK